MIRPIPTQRINKENLDKIVLLYLLIYKAPLTVGTTRYRYYYYKEIIREDDGIDFLDGSECWTNRIRDEKMILLILIGVGNGG